jgi:hypothetical protein
MYQIRQRPWWWWDRAACTTVAGAILGSLASMAIHVLTGFGAVWSYLLLDACGMLGWAAVCDLIRARQRANRPGVRIRE